MDRYELKDGRIVKIDGSGKETVVFDIDVLIGFFGSIYTAAGINLLPNFSQVFRRIWTANQKEILEAVFAKGFDLFILGLPIHLWRNNIETMLQDYKLTYHGFEPEQIWETMTDVQSHIVLLHSEPDMRNVPLLNKTIGRSAWPAIPNNERLTLYDYFVFHRIGRANHPDRFCSTYLPGSMVGKEILCGNWIGGKGGELNMRLVNPFHYDPTIGCRLSQYFLLK